MISKKDFFGQFNSGQNQYTYFIMAIDASGIAFAISRIEEKVFALPLIVFGLALLSWAISFFSGIRFQQLKNEALFISYNDMDIREGDFPGIDNNKKLIESESEKLKSKAEKVQTKMHLVYNFLNYFMILGIIFFVAYEIWEMALRSNATHHYIIK